MAYVALLRCLDSTVDLSIDRILCYKYQKRKLELQRENNKQINPVNGLEPRDQSNRQKQTKVEDKIL